jgi:hypothetical protein
MVPLRAPGEGTLIMSRQGELWRAEIAEQVDAYLDGRLSADDLLDWSMDHPFFDQQADLDPAEQALLGGALGAILQLDEQEPLGVRTTRQELRRLVALLWGGMAPGGQEGPA